MHPVIERLLALPPATPDAAIALARLEAGQAVDETLIDVAIDDARQMSERTHRSVQQCLALSPRPSPRPPLGF